MKLLIKRLLSYFPSKLPVGLTEFHAWADEIIALSGKIADEDSLKFVLANLIMHLKADMANVSKNYFVRSLRKGAANQVAGQVFLDIKEKQAAAQKAAAEAIVQPTEATVQPEVANATETPKN